MKYEEKNIIGYLFIYYLLVSGRQPCDNKGSPGDLNHLTMHFAKILLVLMLSCLELSLKVKKFCISNLSNCNTQWARIFQKVLAKKLVKSNKSNNFLWNCISGSFNLFPQFKNWFLAIFEMAKKWNLVKKNFSWNWFIWFHEFFFARTFF